MKTDKEYSDTIKREVEVDVDALLAAINEISESEVRRTNDGSDHVIVNGRDYHTYRELADILGRELKRIIEPHPA